MPPCGAHLCHPPLTLSAASFGGSFKRPLFSFGARAFSNKPKEAAPGTSPEKAAKEDKPEDAKPPPPKSARREANETDDWIRERIEAVRCYDPCGAPDVTA